MLGMAYMVMLVFGFYGGMLMLAALAKFTLNFKVKRLAKDYAVDKCQRVYRELKQHYTHGGMDEVLSSKYFEMSWNKGMEKKGNLSTLLLLAGWNGQDEPTADELRYAKVIYLEYLENSISKLLSEHTKVSKSDKSIVKKNEEFLRNRWYKLKKQYEPLEKVFACLVF